MSDHNQSRRSFIKKAAYIAPVVLTLKASPSMAYNYGSAQNCPTDKHGSKKFGSRKDD